MRDPVFQYQEYSEGLPAFVEEAIVWAEAICPMPEARQRLEHLYPSCFNPEPFDAAAPAVDYTEAVYPDQVPDRRRRAANYQSVFEPVPFDAAAPAVDYYAESIYPDQVPVRRRGIHPCFMQSVAEPSWIIQVAAPFTLHQENALFPVALAFMLHQESRGPVGVLADNFLDYEQIIKAVFDPVNQAIRIKILGPASGMEHQLDFQQVLKHAFDPTDNTLRVVT